MVRRHPSLLIARADRLQASPTHAPQGGRVVSVSQGGTSARYVSRRQHKCSSCIRNADSTSAHHASAGGRRHQDARLQPPHARHRVAHTRPQCTRHSAMHGTHEISAPECRHLDQITHESAAIHVRSAHKSAANHAVHMSATASAVHNVPPLGRCTKVPPHTSPRGRRLRAPGSESPSVTSPSAVNLFVACVVSPTQLLACHWVPISCSTGSVACTCHG